MIKLKKIATFDPNSNRMNVIADVEEAIKEFKNKKNKNLDYLLKNRFSWMKKFIDSEDKGLEVGAGAGFSKNYIKNKNFKISDFAMHDHLDLKNLDAQNTKFDSNSYDFVIGSRYMEGGKCLMKGRRLILSKYGNLFMKLFLKIDCSEFTTSFRGFNIKKLNNFHLNQVCTNGYSFFMGTIYEIFNRKFSTKEIPITFKDRTKGYSKIPRIEIIRTLFNLLRLKLK